MRPVTISPDNVPAALEEIQRASHENDICEIAQNFDVTGTPTEERTLVAATSKVGTFTRDLALASGNVSYTGVGFRPAAVIFLAAFPTGTAGMCSAGFLGPGGVGDLLLDGTTLLNAVTATAISVGPGGFVNYQYVNAGSMDADGFSLFWNRQGVPVGVATVYYLALGARNLIDVFGTFIADLQKGGMNRTT